jgi:hypothetical protein
MSDIYKNAIGYGEEDSALYAGLLELPSQITTAVTRCGGWTWISEKSGCRIRGATIGSSQPLARRVGLLRFYRNRLAFGNGDWSVCLTLERHWMLRSYFLTDREFSHDPIASQLIPEQRRSPKTQCERPKD